MFQELWGHENVDHILEFMIDEVRPHGDSECSLRKEESEAFLCLCLLDGASKDGRLTDLRGKESGRPVFTETVARNQFHSVRMSAK